MSRVNAIRIVNLNYNNNAIHVDDEIYELGTESTLFSLRNGGGKSVLVQMMSAPFVRKRYRDTKDRPFESYFTSSRPTYILVEWALDGQNGYVLTGMMVRKAAENKEVENQDPLDTVQFIYEYRNRNDFDIYRFPLIKEEDGSKKLLGFGPAKQLFEDLKKDTKFMFNYYDMNLPNQFRSYFDKLKEYGINHKEWESIIKKINLKESGLSELFAEAKDESGLVDKWFLPAVEDKLSKDESRIDKFVELIQKYIRQYRENRENFAKKETIDQFKEETKGLIDLAEQYRQKLKHQTEAENKIANLIASLKHIIENLSIESKTVNLAIDELSRQMNQVECAEIAYDIYLKKDELKIQQEQLKACDDLLVKVETEQNLLNQKIHQYECSRIYTNCQETQKEIAATDAQIQIIRRKDEDLAPERNNLGYSIRLYYQEEIAKNSSELTDQEEKLVSILEEQEDCTVTLEQYNGTIAKYSEENGTLKSNLKAYGQTEAEYNARYKENLSRNIVGTYEDEILSRAQSMIQQEIEELEVRRKKVLEDSEDVRLRMEEKDHQKNDLQILLASEESRREQLLSRQEEFGQRISERKALLPYVNIPEEEIFDTTKIVDAFERRISEIRENQRLFVVAEDEKSKELDQLKSGKVMELPKEIEEKLQNLDLHYLYGTDWLKNNGKTQEENKQLVEANPFIPYAILLSQAEFERLSKTDLGIHTSFPIPIVKREDLESEENLNRSKVYEYAKVSFYVSFNQNLLDREGLSRLITKKTEELEECRRKLSQTQEEMNHFEDKKNVILFQHLSKEEVDQCRKALTQCEKKLDQKQKECKELTDDVNNLRKEQILLVKTSESIGHSLQESKEKQVAFQRLMSLYEQYQKDKERSVYLTDEIKRLKQSIADMKMTSSRLKTKEQEARHEKECLVLKLNGLNETMKNYAAFEQGEQIHQSIDEMEARFQTITNHLHQEETQLLDRLSKAKKRLKESAHELELLVKEYHLQPEDYENLSYSMEMMQNLRKSLAEFESQKSKAMEGKMKYTNEMTRLRTQIYSRTEEYEKKSNGRELIARNELTIVDFKAVLHTKYLERQAKEKELAGINGKLNGCQNVLSSLAEYEELQMTEPMELRFTSSELMRMKNEMLKEYRTVREEAGKYTNAVIQETGRLLRIRAFSEDYYHKPLESLERLADAPEVLLDQLKTTIAAYDNLLLKLSVDLEMIEQEGQKVLDVLLQYIQEVHENLGKIDRNSNITIRNREIKMLKIKLPDWEEEKRTYAVRCKDYVDHLIARAMELLDQNRNIEELVASQITTRNLYHNVVGIGNIGIHLYKIEEEREYPITWAEVSKNSGGEGFLSAFVILSSLLNYMRRDDTDIFNDKDSGKVLIMDNPFAQTNASHLLKPLMDIAKKSNTQLICLSGLGGESIYNRFDNIYVLNLVSSKIKDSMQYLYADHIKGEDLESIVSSRIKIEEEQMVLF